LKVIQLGHESRVGKDTFADAFIDSAKHVGKKIFRIAYADKLKLMIAKKYGISQEEVDFLKNNDPIFHSKIVDFANTILEKDERYFVREVEEKLLWAKADEYDYAIITDLRREEEWIPNALKISIWRPGEKPKSKVDTILKHSKWDLYVKNEHSKQHLASQAHSIFTGIENGLIKVKDL